MMTPRKKASESPTWYGRLAEIILTREGLIGLLLTLMIANSIYERHQFQQQANKVLLSIDHHLEQERDISKQRVEAILMLLEEVRLVPR